MNAVYIIVAINEKKDANNESWVLFGTFTTLSCILVLIGGLALISVSRELQAHSYPMLAESLLGKSSKRLVEWLTLTQSLLMVSCHVIAIESFLNPSHRLWLTLIITSVLLLLTLIRQLWKLSFNYITGNLIACALIGRTLWD